MQATDHRLNGHMPKPTGSKPATKPARRKATNNRWPRADRVLFGAAAVAPWGLAVVLLAVSMPHLAGGFQSICRCGPVAAWLLAVAFDVTQVVAKLQLTMAKRYAVSVAARQTSVAIIAGTTLMSIALNVLAFLAGASDTTGTVLAWVAGVMLPLLVLALSYTGSCFALAERTRPAKGKAGRSN